jgi:hypothetical protein
MGSIMNGGGGATLISGSGTLINAKNVGKSMTCAHALPPTLCRIAAARCSTRIWKHGEACEGKFVRE